MAKPERAATTQLPFSFENCKLLPVSSFYSLLFRFFDSAFRIELHNTFRSLVLLGMVLSNKRMETSGRSNE